MSPYDSSDARRLLERPPEPVNHYPPHSTLSERQLRLLMMRESIEALKMAKQAGLETPE